MFRSEREQARRREVPSFGVLEDEAEEEAWGGDGFSLEDVLASLEDVLELPESSGGQKKRAN